MLVRNAFVWVAGLGGFFAVFLQVVFTELDHFFTPYEMVRYHHTRGLPMSWHFGIMWSDLLFITPLMVYLVYRYGEQWTLGEALFVGLIALVISGVMHWQYLGDNIPNSHMHDGKLTPAAYVHFLFMWGAFTILGLFYFFTPGLTAGFVIPVSILLWIHVVLGTHLIVKLWSPAWFPPQPPADPITLVVWAASAAGLIVLSWNAFR